MIDHFLKRNPDNEPICACGYRPEILDTTAPVGKQWKAKTAVLDHVTAAAPLFAGAFQRRLPDAPFRVTERTKFPRAGVRQTDDGKWLLTCWDGDTIVHVMDEPNFTDRVEAFDYAHMTIGACRLMGTNLNGLEVP